MAAEKIMCSMIEIERHYYPKAFLERKNELKMKTKTKEENDIAQITLKEIENELESISEMV